MHGAGGFANAKTISDILILGSSDVPLYSVIKDTDISKLNDSVQFINWDTIDEKSNLDADDSKMYIWGLNCPFISTILTYGADRPGIGNLGDVLSRAWLALKYGGKLMLPYNKTEELNIVKLQVFFDSFPVSGEPNWNRIIRDRVGDFRNWKNRSRKNNSKNDIIGVGRSMNTVDLPIGFNGFPIWSYGLPDRGRIRPREKFVVSVEQAQGAAFKIVSDPGGVATYDSILILTKTDMRKRGGTRRRRFNLRKRVK